MALQLPGAQKNSSITSLIGFIFLGFVLFIAGSLCLYWNEGSFIKEQRILDEVNKATISVSDISIYDQSRDGVLIHANERAKTKDILKDDVFDIRVNAIALNRQVEYYQWTKVSTRPKAGSLSKVSYVKAWTSYPSDITENSHQEKNSIKVNISSKVFYANRVTFGAYDLPQFLIEEVDSSTPLQERLQKTGYKNQYKVISGNQIYFGNDPQKPEIGDVRVTFTAAYPSDVSIIAQIQQKTFIPFTSKIGSGDQFSSLKMGDYSKEEMITQIFHDDFIEVWLLRAMGTFILCISLIFLSAPLSRFANIIPYFGSVSTSPSISKVVFRGILCGLCLIVVSWLRFIDVFVFIVIVVVAVIVLLIHCYKKVRISSEK